MFQTFLRSAPARLESWAGNLFASILVLPESRSDRFRPDDTAKAEDDESDRLEREDGFYWWPGMYGHW